MIIIISVSQSNISSYHLIIHHLIQLELFTVEILHWIKMKSEMMVNGWWDEMIDQYKNLNTFFFSTISSSTILSVSHQLIILSSCSKYGVNIWISLVDHISLSHLPPSSPFQVVFWFCELRWDEMVVDDQLISSLKYLSHNLPSHLDQ